MSKRTLDLVLLFLTLPITLSLILIGSICVFLFLGFPIFFRQKRIGKDGVEFSILKLRTMKNGKGSDQQRYSFIGSILRKLSIDELPEIYNILKGEMSFVGPRPLPVDYRDYYTAKEFTRHDILPGISGLAQINGRNAISWKSKFHYDLIYLRKQSLSLDLKIIFLTIWKIFDFKKVNASKTVTMLPLDMRLNIIGAGGHALVVADTARSVGIEIKAFYDNDERKWGKVINGIKVLPLNDLKESDKAIIGIGQNKIRKELSIRIRPYPAIMHQTARVSPTAKIGDGSVVFPHASLGENAVVGKHVILNTNSVIEHDSVVEDFVHIAPSVTICGTVHIGKSSFIGAGTTIIPNLKIEEAITVGANSTVTESLVKKNKTYIGTPARETEPKRKKA